jgi:hypothetical protein
MDATFVVVVKPAGVIAVKALPEDFEPDAGGQPHVFPLEGRYCVNYLDPSGEELFVVADPR